MAGYLEKQGERIALLAMMDSSPRVPPPIGDDHKAKPADIRVLVGGNVEESIPDVLKAFWQKAPEIACRVAKLKGKYSPQSYSGNLVLFRAMKREHGTRELLSPADWKPHVEGEIEAYDIDCVHNDMKEPEYLAKIGAVLAQKLDEIHTDRNSRIKVMTRVVAVVMKAAGSRYHISKSELPQRSSSGSFEAVRRMFTHNGAFPSTADLLKASQILMDVLMHMVVNVRTDIVLPIFVRHGKQLLRLE
ncbi:hypothetical protein BGZ65_000702 [Modicella reniformis]|uniref:Uncharacterized protein n=1 Tax=Modicella reniformis TaxID=1440133 RepID=A0A9P6MJF8_9FUNG|nr:hypothetical protein BGZ65_000702 [Modicella reniformis]